MRYVARLQGHGSEKERGGEERGEDISSPGACSSIFPSSGVPLASGVPPSGAVVPPGSGPYERVTHAFLFHTRLVGLRVRTCVPRRGPFKRTCGNLPSWRELAPRDTSRVKRIFPWFLVPEAHLLPLHSHSSAYPPPCNRKLHRTNSRKCTYVRTYVSSASARSLSSEERLNTKIRLASVLFFFLLNFAFRGSRGRSISRQKCSHTFLESCFRSDCART